MVGGVAGPPSFSTIVMVACAALMSTTKVQALGQIWKKRKGRARFVRVEADGIASETRSCRPRHLFILERLAKVFSFLLRRNLGVEDKPIVAFLDHIDTVPIQS